MDSSSTKNAFLLLQGHLLLIYWLVYVELTLKKICNTSYFIYKISRFQGPIRRNFLLFYLYLFGNNLFSYLLSWSSEIRPFSHHAFINNYTNCKIIHSNSMIVSFANFKKKFLLHITSGAIYPGVPLVSCEFSGFHILAIPRSVILKNP